MIKNKVIGNSIKESFDNLPSGVCFADRHGIIVLCNRQMYRLSRVLLGTDLQHIFELRRALENPSKKIHRLNEGENIFLFPDDEIWEFRESVITDSKGNAYSQIQALLMTELYKIRDELKKTNQQLSESNQRVRLLYKNLDHIVKEEEAFAIKMRVHNDIGLRLLSTYKSLEKGDLTELREVGKAWKNILNVFCINDSLPYTDLTDEYGIKTRFSEKLQEFLNSSSRIGVNINIKGVFPKDSEQAYLLITAMRVCVTNVIRHAKGDEMNVSITYLKNKIVMRTENNGKPPESEIVEGGGLSDLRRRIERVNGFMEIQSFPKFKLIVTLPM
ncbi:MAG: hypothetical protein GX241_06925 [Ruminococcaceae bacterium]|nr:hypothetical protein [Oscillospiraceae bacterium]